MLKHMQGWHFKKEILKLNLHIKFSSVSIQYLNLKISLHCL